MKKIKRILTAMAALLAMASVPCHAEKAQATITPPELPSQIIFCGDTIDLTNEYLRERYDREIINFTYGQSQTLQVLKRSRKYFPMIEAMLKKYDIPDDFKYLAAIESNLNPRAASGAKAAGLWQMIPDAAKENGLIINEDVDERYNIELETQAACNFLRQSYKRTGDWACTAASYNTGRTRVMRQMGRQMADNFFEMLFSEETNRYVFRIVALKALMENPEKYGYSLRETDYYHNVDCDTVSVDSSIGNLAAFAKDRGINYMMLKEENPWLRSNKLTNGDHHRYIIRIPKSTAKKEK